MTPNQKRLLEVLSQTYFDLAEECENDDDFHTIISENNFLFICSLDELGLKIKALTENEN